MKRIQWRLVDPTSGQQWSKVHKASDNLVTFCHIHAPTVFELDYETRFDERIPNDAPRCKRCEGNWR